MHQDRPQPGEFAPFYAAYVQRVPAGDIVATLERQLPGTLAPLRGLSEEQSLFAYGPGKWTIREVVGHLSDSERVFAGRALRFARGDDTPLPGFDEQVYTPAGRFNERTLASLLEELQLIRAATVALLRGLPADVWGRGGLANNAHVTVRALAFVTAGHELHHRAILVDRYLTSIPAG